MNKAEKMQKYKSKLRMLFFLAVLCAVIIFVRYYSNVKGTYDRWNISRNWVKTEAVVLEAVNYYDTYSRKGELYDYDTMDLKLQYRMGNEQCETVFVDMEIRTIPHPGDEVEIYVNPQNCSEVLVADTVEYKMNAKVLLFCWGVLYGISIIIVFIKK